MPTENLNVQEAFLKLIRSSLEETPVDISLSSDGEWEELFSLCCRHNVSPLVSAALENCRQVPLNVRLKFAAMQEKAMVHYTQLRLVTAELAKAYKAEGLQTIVLKGLTLSRLYPHPELRQFSDLDMIVLTEDGGFASDKAESIALDRGARLSNMGHHHSTFTYKGIYVENHFNLTSRHISHSAADYERILKSDLMQSLEKMDIDGQEVLTGSADFEALFLIRHSAVHFEKDCVNFRQLLDWMQFLRNRGNLVDWNDVCALYRTFGMEPFVGAVMAILRDKFGYDCPYEFISEFAGDTDTQITERVWNEILFGTTRIQNPENCSTIGRLSRGLLRTYRTRWKHELCSCDPLWLDTIYAIRAATDKLKK